MILAKLLRGSNGKNYILWTDTQIKLQIVPLFQKRGKRKKRKQKKINKKNKKETKKPPKQTNNKKRWGRNRYFQTCVGGGGYNASSFFSVTDEVMGPKESAQAQKHRFHNQDTT